MKGIAMVSAQRRNNKPRFRAKITFGNACPLAWKLMRAG
ncbi:hypothetical protein SEGD1_008 [Enterobacteria phage SEGD1]|uniref:Uncharacterized protein n=1 Tax=Enterobacteria phage SEGD1 TaxID=1805456 RepID=A0A142II71_9CAUD|nr:hypothetical protein SEGD1_008 [Enterobacteria phage SEGD1]